MEPLTDIDKLHVYTDGTDTIFGSSAQEAVDAYRIEVGLTEPGDYEDPGKFSLVPDDKEITVRSDDEDEGWPDGKKTLTAREWIAYTINSGKSRMICSTEY